MAAKDSFILTKDIPNILDMADTLCSVLWDKQTFLHFLKLNAKLYISGKVSVL